MFHRTSEDKIDADEPFRGVLNEGDLVAFSVDGNPVPLIRPRKLRIQS